MKSDFGFKLYTEDDEPRWGSWVFNEISNHIAERIAKIYVSHVNPKNTDHIEHVSHMLARIGDYAVPEVIGLLDEHAGDEYERDQIERQKVIERDAAK